MLVWEPFSQQQDHGKVHPIAYASRSLDQHERNCGVTELELLVWCGQSDTFSPTFWAITQLSILIIQLVCHF